jgi:hypothetical protein
MSNMMEEILAFMKASLVGFEGKKRPCDMKLPSSTRSL